MARDDFKLDRLEVHIPVHYKAFVEAIAYAEPGLRTHRDVIEHLIEFYACDVERRYDGKPPFEVSVSKEQASRAIQRYEEGLGNVLRMQAELDALMKLDAEDADEVRELQANVARLSREQAAREQLWRDSDVQAHRHLPGGLVSIITAVACFLCPVGGAMAVGCHTPSSSPPRESRLVLARRIHGSQGRGRLYLRRRDAADR